MNVGFIGLGAMGAGMARNVAKAGYLAALYNRSFDKAQQLAKALQVTAYDDPSRLAAAVDVVLICVSADPDVLAMIDAVAGGAAAGSVVVDLSTISSKTARQAAERLAAKQIAFLDAPVSGGVEGARNGTLAMMIGGEAAVLDRVKPVLAAMSSRIMHMGPTGSGQATKAVNQIMAAGINQAVTEALAFGAAQGLPMAAVIEVVGGGAAGNWFLDHRGLTMTQGIFKPGFKLALHHKDLKICQEIANGISRPLPLTDKTVNDYERLMAEGLGDEDISALYRLVGP